MTDTLTDRRTWLTERRQGVGASDVAAIGSVPGAYGSPWSVWADKCGLTPLDDDLDDDDPRTFGTDLESLIVMRFERATGLYVINRQEVIRYPEFERWFATIDGEVTDGQPMSSPNPMSAPFGVFESKSSWDKPWDDVPEHYLWQLQWQMLCTGHSHAWLAALFLQFKRASLRVYEVEADPKLINRIQTVVAHFWNNHVVTGDPPPPDDHPATARTIEQLFGHLTTEAYPRLPLDDYRQLVDDLAHWRKVRNDAERFESALAAQLRAVWAAENPKLSEGFIDGELAVTWRSHERTSVDVAAVRAEHGDRYDRTQTIRQIRFHGARLS